MIIFILVGFHAVLTDNTTITLGSHVKFDIVKEMGEIHDIYFYTRESVRVSFFKFQLYMFNFFNF